MNSTTHPAEDAAPAYGHSYRMPLPRLALAPDAGHGPLDGAWWPRCDALELELPALVGSLDPGVGTVARVTVGTAAWPDAPRRVMAPGHVIEVALSDDDAETHAITVDCGTVGRWQLLLTAASDPENPWPAPRLTALAESGLDGHGTRKPEGGTGLR